MFIIFQKACPKPLEKARECIASLEKRISQQEDVELFLESLKRGSHEKLHDELYETGKSLIHFQL